MEELKTKLPTKELNDTTPAARGMAVAGIAAIKSLEDKKGPTIRRLETSYLHILGTDAPGEMISQLDGYNLTIRPASLDNPQNYTNLLPIEDEDGSKIYNLNLFGAKYRDDWDFPEMDESNNEVMNTEEAYDEIKVKVDKNGDVRFRYDQGPIVCMRLDIEIKDTPAGKKLLESMGYQFIKGEVYVPSPETFKKYCKEVGIDVQIFPEKSHLKAPEYLGAYLEGKYPIGALDKFYSHDIQDDHITALIIGGNELQAAIAEGIAISRKRGIGDEDLSANIDTFTNTFRSVIFPGGTLGEAYGEESGRATLQIEAERVGISSDRINELILIAQNNAKAMGLEVKDI